MIAALNEVEQKNIRLLHDLKKEYEAHAKEIRKLTSEISGLETYNRRLEGETKRTLVGHLGRLIVAMSEAQDGEGKA